MEAIIGKKVGMTKVYDDNRESIAVTVIEAGPCVVVQRKTLENDGYNAVQLGFEEIKESRARKSEIGHCKKAGVLPRRILKEFRVTGDESLKIGDVVNVSIFDGVSHVDVSGVTKGRGFAGVVKRYKMGGGPITHGGHSKRRVGSIGQCAFPGRVQKGKRMPGHMGNENVVQQNLRVVGLRNEDNVILVKGAVPGANGGYLVIKKALKKNGAVAHE